MKKFYLLLLLLIVPTILSAQWSEDPSDNMQLSVENDTALASYIVPDHAGNYYVFYYIKEPEPQNFVVYLHKLDTDGNKLWGDGGIKISDNPFDTWISKSSLIVDDDNNAIIAFEDNRDENVSRIVNLYKISPNGEFLWGENGIQLPAEESAAYLSPQIVQTSDNNYTIASHKLTNSGEDGSIMLYRVNSNGEVLTTKEITHHYDVSDEWIDIWPNIVPLEEGNVMLFWNAIQTGIDTVPGGWGSRRLLCQKFNSNLEPAWQDSLVLIDPPTFNAFRLDHSVQYVPDTSNGIYFVWFDNREFNANVHLNHISTDGVRAFGEPGLEITASSENCSNMTPYAHFDASQNTVFMYWIEECIKINYRGSRYGEYGVGANKYMAGKETWEWGNEGLDIMPVECYFSPEIIKASSLNDGNHQVVFITNNGVSIEAGLMNTDGQTPLTFIPLSYEVDDNSEVQKLLGKNDIQITNLANDQWVATWYDVIQVKDDYSPVNLYKLYAQNLNTDGTLGPKPVGVAEKDIEINPDLLIYPNPVTNNINIKLDEKAIGKLEINIYTASGAFVMQINEQAPADNILSFNVENLAKGVYVAKIKIGENLRTFKFVK